ncbi:MAG: type IX secretion system outer membrane channel protein PorV [Bacteroidales bacterium]|jgi:hypothetical protein|nr:type IX secretion system outer membrane channel protein PorV [Bacteroidales bacterium]
MLRKSVIVFLAIICGTLPVFSQVVSGTSSDYLGRRNTITSAVPFLLIAPDSRSGAMGDIGAATSADVMSQHHNPAKYVFSQNKAGVSISYSPWLKALVNDIHLLYVAGYWKITDMDAISMSLRYFSLGNIDFTDMYGNAIMSHTPNEFAIDMNYSRKLTDVLSMAITPRLIYSDLTGRQFASGVETKAGVAGAADLSLFYEQDFSSKTLRNQTLRIGLNISNIGNKMSYATGTMRRDFISTNLKLGLGYSMDFDDYNRLTFVGEINKLLIPTPPVYAEDSTGQTVYDDAGNPVIAAGKDPNVSVAQGIFQSFYDAPGGFVEEMREYNWALGMEYVYRDLLAVRFGYFNESKYKGGRKYFTIGAGVKYNILGIDVSYLFAVNQNHPLENTLRFTLTFDFASFKSSEIKNQGKLLKNSGISNQIR